MGSDLTKTAAAEGAMFPLPTVLTGTDTPQWAFTEDDKDPVE
jgi:hypothetical protein